MCSSLFHATKTSKLQNLSGMKITSLKPDLSRIILESECLYTIGSQCSFPVLFVKTKTNYSPSVKASWCYRENLAAKGMI